MMTLRWPLHFALFISTQELLPEAEVEGRGNCANSHILVGKIVGSQKKKGGPNSKCLLGSFAALLASGHFISL